MHPGGVADKVGNRYEALWLISHLNEMVDGPAQSVTIEPVSDPGIGVEFAVARHDGTGWHQAKPRLAEAGQLAGWRA